MRCGERCGLSDTALGHAVVQQPSPAASGGYAPIAGGDFPLFLRRIPDDRLDLCQFTRDMVLSRPDIISVLQIEPEFGRGAEGSGQAHAVSAVMPVSSLAIRSMRVRGTPQAFAKAPGDISSGSRNSSRRTSPGCIGASFLAIINFPIHCDHLVSPNDTSCR